MELCRLPLWNNRWSEITNYTGGKSWDFLPLDTKFHTFMPALSNEMKESIKFQPELRIIPQTYGVTRDRDETAVNVYILLCLICIFIYVDFIFFFILFFTYLHLSNI